MAVQAHSGGPGRVAAVLAAAALALGTPAQAEIIRAADMLRGIVLTQPQCAAIPQTVWVASMGNPFCVRYYLSTAGGLGGYPVVILAGDKLGRLDRNTRAFYETSKFKNVDTDRLARTAESASTAAQAPAIYLARIGVDGTAGHHSARKTLLELNLMNAALNAIKRQHGFEGFHLVGQSGGALLVGGLIAMRDDIACAVMGAGPLADLTPSRRQPARALGVFDPAEGIPAIVGKRSLRILVVTDHADRTVAERRQTEFVKRLRQAGGRPEQFFVNAIDDRHHNVAAYSRVAVSGCASGARHEEIAENLAQFGTRLTAAKAKWEMQSHAREAAVPPLPRAAPRRLTPFGQAAGAGASR